MERSHINQLKDKQKAMISGFLEESRILSKIAFLIMRDVTGKIQCVIKSEDADNFELAKRINKESVLSITGIVSSKNNVNELSAEKIEVLSEAESSLPIPVVEKGEVSTALNKRLDWRFIDLRKRKNLVIMKALSSLEKGMRDYWINNGFIEIHSPKFMGSPSESGSELFMVPYFGKEAFLAQSPQFYKQMAMAAGFEKVFEIGPVFRANPSHTSRHDTEYTSIDMEVSYIKDHHEVMKIESEWLAHAFKILKDECSKEIKEELGIDIVIPKLPFPKVSMEEAYKIIEDAGCKVIKGEDIEPEHEKILCKWAKEKYNHDFIFIYDWPVKVRPFYHMRTDDGKITKSFDLLYKGIEITSGAQREHRHEVLIKQIAEKKIEMNQGMIDYVNFFKYGCPPHGGLGLSSTRVIMQMLDLKNVREATYLPRDTERLTP